VLKRKVLVSEMKRQVCEGFIYAERERRGYALILFAIFIVKGF